MKCAVLPRKTRATSSWRHKIKSKYYEVGQENWHFIFIEMRLLQAYFREKFKRFLSGALRIKFFIWRYCKYKELASYFSAFMGNELGWGSDKSSEDLSRASPKFIFPWTQKKRHSFLMWSWQARCIISKAIRPLHQEHVTILLLFIFCVVP